MALFGTPGRGDRIARRILLPLLVLFVVLVVPVWITHSPVRVEGDSMEPGLQPDDRILVTRGYREPVVGDIVSVTAPRPRGGGLDRQIKRIAALPGQTVGIDRGRAIVDGVPEPEGSARLYASGDVSVETITVPDGHVYVLGDNRPVSFDSRFYGPLPIEAVHGRVTFIIMPVTRFGPVD